MRKLLGFLVLFVLTCLGFYVSWRSAAPSWQGQDLRITHKVPDEFDILLLGDTGSGNEDQKAVAQALEKVCQDSQAQAVFLLGDNFYAHGVSGLDDPQWQTKFQSMYDTPCVKQLPFYAILGNHDYQQNPGAQITYTSEHPSWHMPHRFYSVDFGKRLRVIALDSNYPDLCGSSSHCNFDFLRESLQADSEEFLVLAHHPIQSLSAKYPGMPLPSRILRQFLCKVPHLFYMSGHSHHLELRRDEECQLDEVINGGGGASLYELRPMEAAVRFAKSTHGFVRLRLRPQTLKIEFWNEQAQNIFTSERPLTR